MDSDLLYTFKEDQLTFIAKEALKFKTIYFPLCGTEATGLKSSITPYLSGDIKVDKNRCNTTQCIHASNSSLPVLNEIDDDFSFQ